MVPKAVTFYKVQVKCDQTEWTIEKRYSEFDTLFNDLKKMFAVVPPMPPKTVFKVKSPEGILKRRQGLDSFLRGAAARPEMLNSVPMINFLEVRYESLLIIAS